MAAAAEVTPRESQTSCREARTPSTYCRRSSSRIVWRVSFVATRAVMPYGTALAVVYALPEVLVLAAIGANVYWISLVMKMRHLFGSSEAAAAAA